MKSLNDPLSGAEIKQIVLKKIEDAIEKNCTLTNDLSYPGFSVQFEIKIQFVRAATEKTIVWGRDSQGESGDDNPDVIEGESTCDHPDRDRVDNDLPVPIMVQTPNGMERRKTHFRKVEQKNDKKSE